jgi:DNA modification methylase
MTRKNLIVNQDAYLFIKQLKKDNVRVDHIITDPPYNISKENNLSTMNGKRQGVDFGSWDYTFDLTGWIRQYAEILNVGGSMIIFNSYLNISYIATALTEAGLVVKDLIKWIKTNPMPRNITRRYVQDTEYAIWAVKPGKKWVFNKPITKPYLRAEFKTPTVSGKEKNGHPTQKSISLMSDIISIHTQKNDVILDPFMGSGSTGEACIKKSRKFIGVELSKEYFEIARNRLSENVLDSELILYNYKEWKNEHK